MRWPMARYRRFFELVGYPYPPAYQLISLAGLTFFCAVATAQRIVAGVSGTQWLVLAAAVALALMPLIGSLVKDRPVLPLLPVCVIGSAILFWLTPVSSDTTVLLLASGAAMSAAVTPPKQAVAYSLAYCAAAVVGHVIADSPLMGVLMVVFGAVVGQLVQLQLKVSASERQARQREYALDRAAIAGEVHDVVAHSLSIVLLNVTAARQALTVHGDRDGGPVDVDDIAEAVEALEDAERRGRAAMNDVRSTIELLRDGDGPLSAQPGLDDIPELVDGVRRTGHPVTLRYTGSGTAVDDATGLAVYRVVQESLTNAAKHAIGTPVTVEVFGEAGQLVARVCNAVPGTVRPTPGGLGLSGMAARVRSCGGVLRTDDTGGKWCVEARFPIDDDPARSLACTAEPTELATVTEQAVPTEGDDAR